MVIYRQAGIPRGRGRVPHSALTRLQDDNAERTGDRSPGMAARPANKCVTAANAIPQPAVNHVVRPFYLTPDPTICPWTYRVGRRWSWYPYLRCMKDDGVPSSVHRCRPRMNYRLRSWRLGRQRALRHGPFYLQSGSQAAAKYGEMTYLLS